MKHKWKSISTTFGTTTETTNHNIITDISICYNCNSIRIRGKCHHEYYTQYVDRGKIANYTYGCKPSTLSSFSNDELKAIEIDVSHVLRICTMEEKHKKNRESIIRKITGHKPE